MTATETERTLNSLRKVLLAILLLGMGGTSIELLLLRHIEDATQLMPLVLIGLGLVTVVWNARRRSRLSLIALQMLMISFVASGVLGMYFHYAANVEFQREVDPALSGGKLWWAVVQAKTPPALAPGVMAQLGLIGLAYAYRRPAAARTSDIEENRSDD